MSLQRVPKDVVRCHILPFLDGRSAARFAMTSKYYRILILSDKRCARLIKYHNIRINHPCEFLRTIGHTVCVSIVTTQPFLAFEGKRSFLSNDEKRVTFNDFYCIGDQAEREIDRIKDDVNGYLVITYEPLKFNRFDLGQGLGTIHRGTSIVIYE